MRYMSMAGRLCVTFSATGLTYKLLTEGILNQIQNSDLIFKFSHN